jgi:hypothetical protein
LTSSTHSANSFPQYTWQEQEQRWPGW